MSRGLTELVVAVLCALALFPVSEARAEVPRLALVVTRGPGAEDCPDAALVVARVSPMTQGEPFALGPQAVPDTWVQIEFSRVLSGYRAVISARGRRQGTRTIDDVGPRCASLGEAVAITLVMLLDPELASQPPLPAPSPAPAAPPAAPAAPVRFGAEAAGGLSLGVLEHAAPFVEGGVTLRVERSVGFALGGGYVFRDRAAVASGSIELELAYAYVRAALRVFERDTTRLLLFAGASTGSLFGGGVDYAFNPEQRLFWIAALLGGELNGALSPALAWTTRLSALIPLRYDEFYVVDAGRRYRAFRTPPIGGLLSFGLAVEP